MKDAILKKIKANKPELKPHPGSFSKRELGPNPVERFTANASLSKSKVIRIHPEDNIPEVLRAIYPQQQTLSYLITKPEIKAQFDADRRWQNAKTIDAQTGIKQLASIQLTVLEANIGVIENGACWLPEQNMGHRALPFSTEHLVFILDSKTLLETMHEGYSNAKVEKGQFGVWIAGPSKTADIEQSLVIGAQGPRSLTVLMR